MNDITNKKFGNYLVLGVHHKDERGRLFWVCECTCGSNIRTIIDGRDLRKNTTQGCQLCHKDRMRENIKTHGDSYTRLYKTWKSMNNRCNDKSNKNYGGRNISVCNEWKNSYELFKLWAVENGYKNNLTIERIDVNGNYEPKNCSWETIEKQVNNKRNTVYLTIDGKTLSLSEWCEATKINKSTAYYRLHTNKYTDKEVIYGKGESKNGKWKLEC